MSVVAEVREEAKARAREGLRRLKRSTLLKRALARAPFVERVLRRVLKLGPAVVPNGRFVALYKQRTGIADLYAIEDPLKAMWADFAMSTVARGKAAVEVVSRHAEIRGKRYLDVGCAHGGFLVAFAHAGAREVVGVDLDDGLLDYARAMREDHRLDARIEQLDVLQPGAVERLGRFDLVTCNDVIEHVDDPKVGLARLAELLNPGGVLFIAVPNRHSANFLASDSHFQRFGLAVLPKQKADAYFLALYPKEKKYDVTYKSLAFYVNHLRRAGCDVEVLNRPNPTEARLDEVGRTMQAAAARAPAFEAAIDPALRDEVRRRVVRLERRYAQQRERVRGSGEQARKLLMLFGEDTWDLVARRR